MRRLYQRGRVVYQPGIVCDDFGNLTYFSPETNSFKAVRYFIERPLWPIISLDGAEEMAKEMKPGRIEDWEILNTQGVSDAGFPINSSSDKLFVVGTYHGAPIRTSFIVHDGSPSYVETNNSIYALGKQKQPTPVEKPLTPIQNQAVAVVKKAIVNTIGDANLGPVGKMMLEDSAQATGYIVIRALAEAHLLVQ
jgi:hypothetical protein